MYQISAKNLKAMDANLFRQFISEWMLDIFDSSKRQRSNEWNKREKCESVQYMIMNMCISFTTEGKMQTNACNVVGKCYAERNYNAAHTLLQYFENVSLKSNDEMARMNKTPENSIFYWKWN